MGASLLTEKGLCLGKLSSQARSRRDPRGRDAPSSVLPPLVGEAPLFLKNAFFFCSLGLLVSSADVLAVPSVHKSLLVPAGYTGTGERRELIQDFNILRSPKGDTPS